MNYPTHSWLLLVPFDNLILFPPHAATISPKERLNRRIYGGIDIEISEYAIVEVENDCDIFMLFFWAEI